MSEKIDLSSLGETLLAIENQEERELKLKEFFVDKQGESISASPTTLKSCRHLLTNPVANVILGCFDSQSEVSDLSSRFPSSLIIGHAIESDSCEKFCVQRLEACAEPRTWENADFFENKLLAVWLPAAELEEEWIKKEISSILHPRFEEPYEEEEDEDSFSPTQYVLSIPDDVATDTIIKLSLNLPIPSSKVSVDIYAADGEEYELCDEPLIFWKDDYLVESFEFGSEGCCLALNLKADKIYMAVVAVAEGDQDIELHTQVFSRRQLQIDVFDQDDEEDFSSDDNLGGEEDYFYSYQQ